MPSQREREIRDRNIDMFLLSTILFLVFTPLAFAGLFTHNRRATATITSLQPSIVNIRPECKITFTYDVGGHQYVGTFYGDSEICKDPSNSSEQLPIRYNALSPHRYYKSEGGFIFFRVGVVAAVLAAVALTSSWTFLWLENTRKGASMQCKAKET